MTDSCIPLMVVGFDFASVAAGSAVVADIDVEGTDELELRGTMSGAGGSVTVKATRKAATPPHPAAERSSRSTTMR
jgi:hypothetical protein